MMQTVGNFSLDQLQQLVDAALSGTVDRGVLALVEQVGASLDQAVQMNQSTPKFKWHVDLYSDDDFYVFDPVTGVDELDGHFVLVADTLEEAWAKLEAWVSSNPCKPKTPHESSRSKSDWYNGVLREVLRELKCYKPEGQEYPSVSRGGNQELDISLTVDKDKPVIMFS
jgi:hypothetical protein